MKKETKKLWRGELLTIQEAADSVRLGKTTMYALVKDGTIPSFKPDTTGRGKIMIDSADLHDWMEKRKTG